MGRDLIDQRMLEHDPAYPEALESQGTQLRNRGTFILTNYKNVKLSTNDFE